MSVLANRPKTGYTRNCSNGGLTKDGSKGRLIKREDMRKRNNFFFHTLNNANVIYSPCGSTRNGLFATSPIGVHKSILVKQASQHLHANFRPTTGTILKAKNFEPVEDYVCGGQWDAYLKTKTIDSKHEIDAQPLIHGQYKAVLAYSSQGRYLKSK